MIRAILFFIGLYFSIAVSGQSPESTTPTDTSKDSEVKLPCFFSDNLIYLSVVLSNNDSLTFYTDTGGKNFLYRSGIKELGVRRSKTNLWERSELNTVFSNNNVPLPKLENIYYMKEKGVTEDGMLGREWFADRIWRIDYPNSSFYKIMGIDYKEFEPINSLYFLKDSSQTIIHHLPRIEVVVEKDTLSFLLDTGAQVFLTNDAQKQMERNSLTAISFISSSIFDKWKHSYPEWEIIKNGDGQFKEDMIRVPEIQIGNKIIGPVWFANRAEQNFQTMSRMFMDKEIVGALGGNALSLLGDIILDYQNEKFFVHKKLR